MTSHEILGLNEGVSTDVITERYNIMIRKLKEADLSGSPLEKDRNVRIQQLRAAYEDIVYGIPMPDHLINPFETAIQLNNVRQSPIEHIQKLIDQERFEEAIQQLQLVSNEEKDACWKYLFGIALWGKGLANDAVNFLQQATAMEPDNQAYAEAYRELQGNINAAIQSEKNKRNAEIAGGVALAGTGLCASCMCDACCNS
jgi:tetratricopeptide (TPR) repeat protein